MTSEGCYAAHAVRPGGCAGCCAPSRPSVRQRECGQANPRPHSRLWCASLQRGVKRQWCIAAWGAAFARCSQPVRPGCMFHGARKRRRARTSLPVAWSTLHCHVLEFGELAAKLRLVLASSLPSPRSLHTRNERFSCSFHLLVLNSVPNLKKI